MAPLGILLISGGAERAHYAFVIAAGAAALGRDVVVFATNEGTRALCADIAHLDAQDRPAGVASLAELRAASVDLGVRMIACETGLLMAGIAASALLDGAEIAGVATFLAAVGDGQMLSI
ncbi:MAG: DsrE/DsrF/DrsH-like family protein [Acetobacteraceae bacterium]